MDCGASKDYVTINEESRLRILLQRMMKHEITCNHIIALKQARSGHDCSASKDYVTINRREG